MKSDAPSPRKFRNAATPMPDKEFRVAAAMRPGCAWPSGRCKNAATPGGLICKSCGKRCGVAAVFAAARDNGYQT